MRQIRIGILSASGVAVFLFFCGPYAKGAEAPAEKRAQDILRLEEAIRIALENHPQVKVAREKIGVQEAILGQELSAYYPRVTFENLYRSSTTAGTVQTTPDAFDFYSSQARLQMTLYNFGRREGTVQSARDLVNASQHAFRTSIDGVVLAVKVAYYSYLAAAALVKVREEALKTRELLVRQARGFYEVGVRPRIDVARAESNLFNARADLIAAQNAVKVAWATLKNTMGVPDLPERPLAEELTITPPRISLNEAKTVAFASRPELMDLEAQRKAADQRIASARRSHLPEILFDASYGRRNSSRSGEAFPLQVNWSVQLSLNIPIFEGFRTTHQVQEELHNYNSIRAREAEVKQQVALEVERSYLNLIEAQEKMKATEAAVRAAKENLDLANGRYQVGVGTVIEVTDAQTLYTEAQTNHIRALYDHKIAEAQLIKAMGRE